MPPKYPGALPPLLSVCCLLVSSGLAHAQTPTPSGERLRDVADLNDIWIGGALPDRNWTAPSNLNFIDVVDREYTLVTPMNALKLGRVQPSPGVFDFTASDQVVNVFSMLGQDIHGHTLVWYGGGGMPSWIRDGSWTAASLTAVMENHIDTVAGRYAGQIAVWDVVNESFAKLADMTASADGTGQPWTNSLRGNKTAGEDKWYDVIGPTYIEKAFTRARAADPDALLIYNDYEIEPSNYKSSAVYKMALDFQSRGIPFDGIGSQMHLSVRYNRPHPTLRANFQRFSDLGLKTFVTEFDCPATVLVEDPVTGLLEPVADTVPPTPFGLDRQARSYYSTLDMALRVPSFAGFQTWGVTNHSSEVAKLPFSNTGFIAQPAYYAMQDALVFQTRTELIGNPRFESGVTSPWSGTINGSTSTLTLTSVDTHSGNAALAVTARGKASAGPGQNITTALLDRGAGRYYVRAWMRTASGTASGKLTLRLTDSVGTRYIGISKPITDQWTEVSGWINVSWRKVLSSAAIYAETPGSTVDFFIDDLTLSDGNLVQNASFEDGTTGWSSYSGGTVSATTTDTALNLVFKYGAGGSIATGRTASYNGPSQNITDALLASGPGTFNTQAWVKFQKPDASTVLTGNAKITVKLRYGGVDYYKTTSQHTISSEGWSKVEGALNLNWTAPLESARIYVETPGSTDPVYVDEVFLRK